MKRLAFLSGATTPSGQPISVPATAGRDPKTPTAERGCLVLADICGYTDYLVESPLTFAEDVLADVTGIVAQRLGTVLRVNKLEGDAVFAYAPQGTTDASMLLDTIDQCYFAFRSRLEAIGLATACGCQACVKLPDLDLKFVVHSGEFVRRGGKGGEELTGRDVIIAHRLLKNDVLGRTGKRAYVLLTEAAVSDLGLDPGTLGLEEHVEGYPDVGEVRGYLGDLVDRYLAEKARLRVFVSPEDAAFELVTFVDCAPPRVWEYLTAPSKRALWTGREVVQADDDGGRRGAGTSYCVDARASVYEEILDWRPFGYFTETRTLPGGAKLVVTTELEPTGAGTVIRVRGSRLAGRDRLKWLASRRRVLTALRRGHERLAALVGQRA